MYVKMPTPLYKMYFLTLRNIGEIDKGIQCGHAALRYAAKFGSNPEFKEFIETSEIWCVLNGGTTKTMSNNMQWLLDNKIKHTFFIEEDLNDALTSICWLVPEKVFNRKDYPDFPNKNINYENYENYLNNSNNSAEIAEEMFKYENWVESLGGEQNVKMREFINKFKTA